MPGGEMQLVFGHGGDPIPDLSRRGSGAPAGRELPICSLNAHNEHFWKLPQEKRSGFSNCVMQTLSNGGDISLSGIARIADSFK
jgi:hypothetical protein